MNEHKLSEGSLKAIMKGNKVSDPIMQLLGSKKINSNSSEKERYRIILSDGLNSISFAMLTTQVSTGCVSNNSIIKVKKYITSTINNANKGNTKVVLILDLEVLVDGDIVGHVIGNPIVLQDDKDTTSFPGTSNTSSSTATNGTSSYTVKSETNTNSSLNNSISDSKMINPISSLTPYHNKWVIKARVSSKSDMRTWSNSRGEGKLFSMDLMDEGGEIRCTAFRDVADKYFNYIQVDKVYYFSKCQLKPANKNFTQLKNDYEMVMNSDSIVEECASSDDDVPKVKYNFVPISTVAEAEVGSLLDIIGVCRNVGDVVTITARKTLKELKKRDIQLVDQSKKTVTLTLWGSQAEDFNNNDNPVILVKGVKVGEFGGAKNLSTLQSSQFRVNPDIPECYRIKGWFDLEGKNAEVENISERVGMGNFQTPWMTFREIQEGNCNSERGEYYQLMGTILLVRSENAVYKSCPTADCKKKVVDLENGMYRCEKCNREYPNFKYRLLLSMNVGDWDSNQWVNLFANEAEKVLGKTSEEVGHALENEPEVAANIFRDTNFKQFIFKCRTKLEVYNDEERLKTVVTQVDPINYEEYNSHLVSTIERYLA